MTPNIANMCNDITKLCYIGCNVRHVGRHLGHLGPLLGHFGRHWAHFWGVYPLNIDHLGVIGLTFGASIAPKIVKFE